MEDITCDGVVLGVQRNGYWKRRNKVAEAQAAVISAAQSLGSRCRSSASLVEVVLCSEVVL
jgi:hypothetical protein